MEILSLGAGVQSSTLFLMALAGEVGPTPTAAIFADTQAEPPGVYAYLDYLEEVSAGRIPIIRATAGSLETAVLDAIGGSGTGHAGQPPFFVRNNNPEHPDSGGMLWRKCTGDFKLSVIRREARRIWDEAGKPAECRQWVGISTDEAIRMKDSGVKYVTNRFPLIELSMSRHACLEWLKGCGYRLPEKSSCFFCPYHSDRFWREMQQNDPPTFEKACTFDAAIRKGKLPGCTGDVYLHRSFVPLSEIDFTPKAVTAGQQAMFEDGFGNECEGLCGV